MRVDYVFGSELRESFLRSSRQVTSVRQSDDGKAPAKKCVWMSVSGDVDGSSSGIVVYTIVGW